MGKISSDLLKFKKQDSIGVSDAADDEAFLLKCFIDTGDYESVKDFANPRCLVLGRTGVGKTALVTKLAEDKPERVITINPEALAMRHISNSTIIRYLHELDVDLNTFFKLLWRHEICVQIFVRHFKVVSDTEGENVLDKIRYNFKKRNPRHLRSLEYLEDWKNTFWKESDSHVVEMIQKTESEVGGVLGGSAAGLAAKLTGVNKLTEEEVYKIKQRGQAIVDEVQMQKVAGLLDMLNDVVEFDQKQYYIVLDRLDESWVDDSLRYRLIKSLIETVRDLNRFDNIKPVVALRIDLLGHVFEVTKDTGFQEEKYASLYLNVHWTKDQLIELVDERINYLLQARYEKKRVLTHRDVLPETIDGKVAIDYVLERTLMRPRDVIDFFNTFIGEATGNNLITEDMILSAEKTYSRKRLDSLYFEWFSDYRNLKPWVRLLRKQKAHFQLTDFNLNEIQDMSIEYAAHNQLQHEGQVDKMLNLTTDFNSGKLTPIEFRNQLMYTFYHIGIVGITTSDDDDILWSYNLSNNIESDDLDDDTVITIHPCFRSALAVKH